MAIWEVLVDFLLEFYVLDFGTRGVWYEERIPVYSLYTWITSSSTVSGCFRPFPIDLEGPLGHLGVD